MKQKSAKGLFLREKEVKRPKVTKQPLSMLMLDSMCLFSVKVPLSLGMEELFKEYENIFPKKYNPKKPLKITYLKKLPCTWLSRTHVGIVCRHVLDLAGKVKSS